MLLFLLASILNSCFLIYICRNLWIIRLYYTRRLSILEDALQEVLKQVVDLQANKKKPEFSSVKKVRPEHGSHIFIWDAEQKIAIPSLYGGSEQDWKDKKDKEIRFTHFIELCAPQ